MSFIDLIKHLHKSNLDQLWWPCRSMLRFRVTWLILSFRICYSLYIDKPHNAKVTILTVNASQTPLFITRSKSKNCKVPLFDYCNGTQYCALHSMTHNQYRPSYKCHVTHGNRKVQLLLLDLVTKNGVCDGQYRGLGIMWGISIKRIKFPKRWY